MRFTTTLFTFLVVFGADLPARSQGGITDALQGTLPKGWECLQGPNELDHPGRTFYVDASGVRFELADLADRIKPATGEVSSIVARASGRVSAGIVAKLLGFGQVLDVSASKTYATAIALLKRQEVRTEEADARAALRTLDPALIDSANSYYIIRNVQLSQQIRLTVDKGVAGAFGGEIPFRGLFTVSGGAAANGGKAGDSTAAAAMPREARSAPIISAQDSNTFTIDQAFDKPLTVCFLAQKFTLKNVAGGAGGSIKDARLLEEFWHPATTDEYK
ncbi:MAG: hypothetical protein MIL41_00460 [Hyphomicrobiales bacterium]|jgi:hypothetical protein